VPNLAEMGIPATTTLIRGDETLALPKLAELCSNSTYIRTFEKKSAPTSFEPQPTTLFSLHLYFGSLREREFWWRVQDVIAERKKK
jgi:cryptochrome